MMAQGPILVQNFNFEKDQYTLEELSSTLQKQSDISISYDAKKIKSNTKIKLPKRLMTTKELVVLLNKNYQIKSKFIGTHIILQKETIAKSDVKMLAKTPNPKKKSKKKIEAKATQTVSANNNQGALALVEVENIPSQMDTILSFNDTFTADQASIQSLGWAISPVSAFVNINKDIDRLDDPEIINLNTNWYERYGLEVGIFSSELFYINPTVNVYWYNFHLIGTYAIKSNASHFRIGFAYKQMINEKVGLMLSVSQGNIPSNARSLAYEYDTLDVTNPDSPIDVRVSGQIPYAINSKLLKIGLDFNWHLNKNISFFGGLYYNRLSSQVFHNNTLKAPRDFVPSAVALREEDFRIFSLPWTSTDDFSLNTSVSRASWIGFQLGFRLALFKN